MNGGAIQQPPGDAKEGKGPPGLQNHKASPGDVVLRPQTSEMTVEGQTDVLQAWCLTWRGYTRSCPAARFALLLRCVNSRTHPEKVFSL